MTIQSFKMGPGTMTFGPGGVQDVSCQITKGSVVPSVQVDTTDAIPVLCGEEIAEEEEVSYTWALEGTVVQDILAAGFVAYTWTNKGTEVAFKFVPNTVVDRGVTGTVRIDPITLGGDVKVRNTSDFSFKIIGDPVLGDATP